MTKRQFILRLTSHIKKKSIFNDTELVNYSISTEGKIRLYYLCNMIYMKTMTLNLNDIGCFSISENVVFDEPRDDIMDAISYGLEYVPFRYLKEQGVL